jgi:hypothetical protein
VLCEADDLLDLRLAEPRGHLKQRETAELFDLFELMQNVARVGRHFQSSVSDS